MHVVCQRIALADDVRADKPCPHDGAALAGQQQVTDRVVNDIKVDKDNKIADAFDKTFFFAAVVLALASVLGFFTDKRTKSGINSVLGSISSEAAGPFGPTASVFLCPPLLGGLLPRSFF